MIEEETVTKVQLQIRLTVIVKREQARGDPSTIKDNKGNSSFLNTVINKIFYK